MLDFKKKRIKSYLKAISTFHCKLDFEWNFILCYTLAYRSYLENSPTKLVVSPKLPIAT
jgi:hypothetical protein